MTTLDQKFETIFLRNTLLFEAENDSLDYVFSHG